MRILRIRIPGTGSHKLEGRWGVGRTVNYFIYRRPTLYPLEIAVDFLKSL
jgi:hypothetical protein